VADFVFNASLGRVVELYRRVDVNDPANSALVFVVLKANGISSDAVLKDCATLAAVLTSGTTAEASNSGYARKVLTDANLTAIAADNAGDQAALSFQALTWTAVGATGGAWAKLLVCYDPDTTAGTDGDIVPLTAHDVAVTPNGTNITVTVPTTGFFRAT
jgi:hypothetical protein